MTSRALLPAMLLASVISQAAAAPLIVAHRGASHDAPENTLAAFRLAWQQGADAIEGDFHLTQDGHIVCIHDATTKRTARTNLAVAKSTLAQLRTLDVGAWKGDAWRGERIPTLEEVLALVPAGKKTFIEIKCGPEVVPVLKKTLTKCGLEPAQTVVIAFDEEVIAAVKNEMPSLQAFWLTSHKQDAKSGQWRPSREEIFRTLETCRANGLDSQAHERIDGSWVRALRARQKSLHVWTVDDPAVAVRFWKLGAESITTNRPEWLRREANRLLEDETGGQVQSR